jgi:FtsP/CotA-like multicopper oxidase with cupredoxin domain
MASEGRDDTCHTVISAAVLSTLRRNFSLCPAWAMQCARSQPQSAATTPVISVAEGQEIALEARYQNLNFAGQFLKLMTYNVQMPGPVIEARPGQTVRLRFKNGLDQPTNLL